MLHTAGKDFVASAIGDRSGSRAAVADYLALSTDATAPTLSDTVLAVELNAAGGGLNRKAAAYAHTTGASTYTLTATFTANANDNLPKTVNKVAVFNASTIGTMAWSSVITAATFNAAGDAATVTETISLS